MWREIVYRGCREIVEGDFVGKFMDDPLCLTELLPGK